MQEAINTIGCTHQIFPLLKEKGFKKLLLVTSKRWLQHESLSFLNFGENELVVSVIHPPTGLIDRDDLNVLREIKAFDCILAFGGGKTIDFAKGILFTHGQVRLYFIAVPTTAGSGSEATPFAVIYEGKTKKSLQNSSLLPDMVLLDPDLLSGMPRRQKAISAVDAFAQCIEALWNIHATPESDVFASEGLRLIIENMQNYLNQECEEANSNMMSAANLSGKAIAITRTTGPHALSYYLTANHSVPHGQAVAVFLPMFFIYNAPSSVDINMRKIWTILKVDNEKEAFETTKAFVENTGLSAGLGGLKLNKVDLEKLVDSVNRERFQNNPAPFDKERLLKIIRKYCY